MIYRSILFRSSTDIVVILLESFVQNDFFDHKTLLVSFFDGAVVFANHNGPHGAVRITKGITAITIIKEQEKRQQEKMC